jgi:hypothetical protein
MVILIPFRPSRGGLDGTVRSLHQNGKFEWCFDDGEKFNIRGDEHLLRTLEALNKNSVEKHDIRICLDSDMFPNKNWLHKFRNVKITKSTYTSQLNEHNKYDYVFKRYFETVKESIMNCEDDEFVCYAYLSDLICSKDWDKNILDALKKHGTNCVYTPMWVEARVPSNNSYDPTPHNVWDRRSGWRKDVCHCLIFPVTHERVNLFNTQQDSIKEEEFEEWAKAAIQNKPFQDQHKEKCGARDIGYFTAVCGTAGKLKQGIAKTLERYPTGSGWDLHLESNLGNKIVITNSFLFHTHFPFELKKEDA